VILVAHEIILPMERTLHATHGLISAVFYLPLGYWVIVAYLERWWAALYLAPGIAAGLALYGHPDMTVGTELLLLLVMASSAPLVFALLSWTAGRVNEPADDPHAWRLIVTAGTLTAVLNGLGLCIIEYGTWPDAATIMNVVQASASGFVGLVALLVLLALGFRLQDQMQGGR
jgi:hypothetical protein